MKNQGLWIMRIVALAIGMFVVAYMGYHVVSALTVPLRTVTANIMKTEETAAFSGVVIRDEAAIELPSGLVELQVAEGEKVSKNQVIAVMYADATTMQVNERIRTLESRLEQLEYIQSRSASSTDSATLEAEIMDSLIGVMAAAADGEILRLHDDALALKSTLFRREYAYGNLEDLAPMISGLTAEIDGLKTQVSSVTEKYTAPAAGVFGATTDGLEESLSPQTMGELTGADVERLSDSQSARQTSGRGKLVYGLRWHLMLTLDADTADRLGSAALVRFDDMSEREMRVDSVRKQGEGDSVVALSSDAGLAEVVSARSLSGDLIISRYEGVRVPKEAVRVDENGEAFVYCLVLSQVKKKTVNIIREVDRENYFLVEYQPGSANNLLPGDEMVVAGKELYDGKVIR